MAKILLVEDENDILETTKFTMEAMGYQCVTAVNGMQGYKKAMSENPDLVVLDMMMPIMSGMEVLHKIRQVHTAKALPVIMLTAVSDKKNVSNILALGVSDYVIKPFDINVLVQKVQNVLGSPDEHVGLTEDDDITILTVNNSGQSVSEAIIDAFSQMSKLCQENKKKFVMNFSNLLELSNADLRRIGDGIGTATEEKVDLKFVISSVGIKEQFLGFYETRGAEIYKSYQEAMEVFKKQEAVKIVEREGILVLTYTDKEATLFTSLKEMFKCVYRASSDGKKKFVLSYEDFFNFDNVDLSATKLIVDSYLEFRKRGIDARFVFPTKKAKEWFHKVSEGINIEFHMSVDDAIEKFSRDWIFSLNENGEYTVLTLKRNLNSSRVWGALKGIFRSIFELNDEEGKKKFILDLSGLKSLDSQSIKLLEGAHDSALADKIAIKIIATSLTLKEQLENFQGTENIEVYEKVEEVT